MKTYYKPTNLNKRRVLIIFFCFLIAAVLLCVRVGYWQIVKGDELSKMAMVQQKKDQVVAAKRGVITDRNGKELAISSVSYTVWARSTDMKYGKENVQEENFQKGVSELAKILKLNEKELYEKINSRTANIKIEKYLDRETADKIREAKIRGVSITSETKRFYPLGSFAANLLGSVNDENNGLSGIENKYNKELKGTSGRWIKNTDRNGKKLASGEETYYAPEDGNNVVLTIDQAIQYYTEAAIKKAYKETGAEMVNAIVMEPKTGEVLAMATYPSFDPNNSRQPLDKKELAKFEKMSSKKQLEYLNTMWRSPLINDTYEPGSTAKLITTSMALEEGITKPTGITYYCEGSIHIADAKLKCWNYPEKHGAQNLTKAVGNSCNTVMARLSTKIGITKFYDYLDLFGITEYTGIDFPGEATSLLQNKATAGPVGIATMGYGQGVAFTPIQLITAICSIGNEGELMQPRLVKEIQNSDGKTIETFDPKIIRKTVSDTTAKEVKKIMTYVVNEGGAGAAKLPGYKVGGKTGTAQIAKDGKYGNGVNASFVGLAPIDDPQLAVLIVTKRPTKGPLFGSSAAAPYAREIFENSFNYLGVKPNYTTAEKNELKKTTVKVPNLKGESYSEAIGVLKGLDLKYKVSPDDDSKADFKIVDQYPKAGMKVKKGTTLYLYKD